MTQTHYWISTEGTRPIVMSLITTVPDPTLQIMYGIVECNFFTYHLFRYFQINLKARNKFKWLLKSRKAGLRVAFAVTSLALLLTLMLVGIRMI